MLTAMRVRPPPEGQGWTAVLDNTLHTRVFDAAGNLMPHTPNPDASRATGFFWIASSR